MPAGEASDGAGLGNVSGGWVGVYGQRVGKDRVDLEVTLWVGRNT